MGGFPRGFCVAGIGHATVFDHGIRMAVRRFSRFVDHLGRSHVMRAMAGFIARAVSRPGNPQSIAGTQSGVQREQADKQAQ